jgi:hypothetical protein
VNLSQLNSATRGLKGQGVAEAFANPGSGSTGTSRGAKRIANTVKKALAKNDETPEQRAARKDFEARIDAKMATKKGVAEGKDDKIAQLKKDHDTAVHWSKNDTNPHKREAARQKAEKIKAHLEKQYKQGVAEAQNDYFKRRKDEEDRISGTKAPAKRTPKQTDYEKKRRQQSVAEMSSGSVATVVNPTLKNKAKVGSLFGGTYKQAKAK